MLRIVPHRLLCLTVLLLTVCVSYASPCHRSERRVTCEGVANVTHLSSSGMNLWLNICNDTAHRLTISRGEVDILINDKVVATISLRERVRVPRRSRGEVLFPLRFRSYGHLAAWQVLRLVLRDEDKAIAISYNVRGGVGLMRRTFSAENIAVSEFFDTFAINREFIGELDAELK